MSRDSITSQLGACAQTMGQTTWDHTQAHTLHAKRTYYIQHDQLS